VDAAALDRLILGFAHQSIRCTAVTMMSSGMASGGKQISPAAYGALANALAVIFWNRKPFERYLRRALRDHPELLAQIDFDDLKRVVAEEVVDRLMANERRYQDITLGLMLDVSHMETFTNLEQQRDRTYLVPQAEAAVAELRRFTAQYGELLRAQAEFAKDLEQYRSSVQKQQNLAESLDALKAEFLALQGSSDPQGRGREFERFLYRLFALFDLEPHLAYSLKYQQIDGSLTFDTDDYIIEAKWWKEKVEYKDVVLLNDKVLRKGRNTLGLFISVSGFTSGALEAFREKTSFITMDGGDIFYVLDQRIRLDDLLRRKRRYASDTGSCYCPVSQILGSI
jgi:hypothetical protein